MEELIERCLLELALDYHQINQRVRDIPGNDNNPFFVDHYLDILRPGEYEEAVQPKDTLSRQLSKLLAAKLLEKGVQLPNYYSK